MSWSERMERSFEVIIEHVGPDAPTRLEAHGPYWYWVVTLPDGTDAPAYNGTFWECRDMDIRYSDVRRAATMCDLFNALWPSVAAISN